jgi:hypothetical protein
LEEDMKCYRIKNLVTGMYFIPSRRISVPGKGWVKSNWSKIGKIYPSLARARCGLAQAAFYLPKEKMEIVEVTLNDE